MRRENVMDLVEKIPGVSYNEIVRETGLSNGVVSRTISLYDIPGILLINSAIISFLIVLA